MAEQKQNELFPQIIKPFSFLSPWFEEDWFPTNSRLEHSGLSISEDTENVYVEAALPGINLKDIDITFDKGLLWIKGQRKEEEKNKDRSYYRKAMSSYSYHLNIPGNVDQKMEPEANYKDGVLTVTFRKTAEEQPKKITVKKAA